MSSTLCHRGRAVQDGIAVAIAELAPAEEDAHRQHALERGDDRRLGAGSQQVGEIAHRNAQRAYVGNFALRSDRPGIGMGLDRR